MEPCLISNLLNMQRVGFSYLKNGILLGLKISVEKADHAMKIKIFLSSLNKQIAIRQKG